jgi:hypothetical protein
VLRFDMYNFLKEIYPIITVVVAIITGFGILSYLLFLYDTSLAKYFTQYIFPIFFMVIFISMVKERFHE